jgi:hypothetical protein
MGSKTIMENEEDQLRLGGRFRGRMGELYEGDAGGGNLGCTECESSRTVGGGVR